MTGSSNINCFGFAAGSGINGGDSEVNFGTAAGLKGTPSPTGGFNAHYGTNAGRQVGTGKNTGCTIIGDQSGAIILNQDYTNFTGIGSNTQQYAGNNVFQAGNHNVTTANIQVGWTITSDIKYKTNITPLDIGLDFIERLKPVSYRRINGDGNEELGLIAQDLLSVLPRPLGMLHMDETGDYRIRKDDLFAILIKAVQDLSAEVRRLRAG